MKLFKKAKVDDVEVKLKYTPIPMTPALLQRQYEEVCYKKYDIVKKNKCVTK